MESRQLYTCIIDREEFQIRVHIDAKNSNNVISILNLHGFDRH